MPDIAVTPAVAPTDIIARRTRSAAPMIDPVASANAREAFANSAGATMNDWLDDALFAFAFTASNAEEVQGVLVYPPTVRVVQAVAAYRRYRESAA